MTRNLFVGADLRSAYQALGDPGGLARLPALVSAIHHDGDPPGLVQRTRFAARAVLLAEEIAVHRPHLVGVQEAAVWRSRPMTGEGDPVVEDHLAILEAELERRGVPYRRASTVEAGDVELPGAQGRFVRLVNQGAVLAREDVEVTGATSGRFETTVQIRTPHGTFGLTRGWAAVDAAGVRFVTTHLELAGTPEAAAVQLAQAQELADGPAAVEGPVVAVGDFNATPGSRTYQALIDAGFTDAWPADEPGPTCCHRFPLDDPDDRLRRRIDLVLLRGGVEPVHADRVGHRPEDFRDGVWASDHAGVVAELRLR